nr:MAG TPA: hypothetical protein [Caudoviricetes sp.]
MATSSIYREVNVKDKGHVRKLVNALERSRASKAQEVKMSRKVNVLTKEQMEKMFGGNDERL